MSGTKFNPSKSQVSANTLAKFLKGEIDEDIQSVPGIGPKAAELLAGGTDPVKTTYQLIGIFLLLRGEGMTSEEHCQAFYDWLSEIKGITAYRSGIVVAIAERVNLMIPGIYEV